MRDTSLDLMELPSDPAELTRELALQVFERTDLIFAAYAQLAAPTPIHAQHHTPTAAPVLVEAASNA